MEKSPEIVPVSAGFFKKYVLFLEILNGFSPTPIKMIHLFDVFKKDVRT
jgi:hypothetical protein